MTFPLHTRLLAVLLLASSIFLTGCFSYEEVEMLGVENVRMKEMGAKNLEVEVTVRIKNPNPYKITVVSSDLDLFINGDPISKAKIKNKVVIPKNSTESHTIVVTADPRKLMENPFGTILGMIGKPLKVGVKGKIKAKARFLSKSFPVDVEERVRL